MTERAIAPVVGKALEIGVVLLYVSVVTAALYGTVVPEYRTAAGVEVGDRVLASTAAGIETGTPAAGRNVSVRERVDLPERIRDRSYTIHTEGATLVLDHPHPEVGGRMPLALPDRVVAVRGVWHSDRPARLLANSTVVELDS